MMTGKKLTQQAHCGFLTLLVLLSGGVAVSAPVRESAGREGRVEGVIAVSASPFARLHDVPIRAVRLGDGFWRARLATNARVSIPAFLASLEQAGAMDKLRGLKNNARGNSDADVGKWLEAASFVLQSEDDAEIRNLVEKVIDDLLLSGKPGGYLHTRYMQKMPAELAAFKGSGQLYCLGHLLQGAIAYHRATGDRRLLDILASYAGNVADTFGPGKQRCWSGHPGIEMALIELCRTTGERKYLDLARYLTAETDLREVLAAREIDFDHYATGIPFPARKELVGHAVCALYACCGATDYYIETGDERVWQALMGLWRDLTRFKMYVTGGVGSVPAEEAIGGRYDLPNERGYAETCAAAANVMWNWRLLNASGEARFADALETALYNGFLSGVSLDGRAYFYWNPLLSRAGRTAEPASEGSPDLIGCKKATGVGLDVRQPWFRTPCCLPNVQRVLASLPGYMYSTSPQGVWVHLYHRSRLTWRSEAGEDLVLVQNTKYPWAGDIEILFERAPAGSLSLFLRLPYWSTRATISINAQPYRTTEESGVYCEVRRRWKDGDRVEVAFDMPVRAVHPNPSLAEDAGRIALQRGPLLYCLESVDHPDASIFDIAVPVDASGAPRQVTSRFEPDFLGGVTILTGIGLIREHPLTDEPLYSFKPIGRPAKQVPVKAIPYFAWANRGPSDMAVWVPWTSYDGQR